MPELRAIWRHWKEEAVECTKDDMIVHYFKETTYRLLKSSKPPVTPKLETVVELARPQTPVYRSSKRYKLLKTDVEWTSKPQVLAIAAILEANMAIGDERDETDIVHMIEVNKVLLNTVQEAKRIWDYYKGDHAQGLEAHGNIERV